MPAIDQLARDWAMMMKETARMISAGLVPSRIQAEGCSIGWLGMAIVDCVRC